MYIPTTYFSTQGSCFTVTTSTVSGTGTITTGSFVSGGVVWDYYEFDNTTNANFDTSSFTANFNVLSGSTGQAKILVVAGGGGGGYNPGDACINAYVDTLGSAGGGGGGGVVYYNQFPLSSGSYEISVGAGGRGAGSGGTRIGSNGGITYFKNKDFSYTPFTSSFITAYGGGGGAGCARNCSFQQAVGVGVVGASSGGGANTQIGNLSVPQVDPLNVFGGIPQTLQGNGSGFITTSPYGDNRAAGGGGAASTSPPITSTYSPFAGSPAGSGLEFNLTGTALRYGAGGSGIRWASSGGGTLTGNGQGWGNPGSGGTGGFGGRFGNVTSAVSGLGGTVIIAIPRCKSAFTCREFRITGNGGVASFLQCNNQATSSTTLASGFDIISCLQTYSGSITPVVATGATYVALSASCDMAFTSSDSGCTNCNTYAVTADTNKIAKVTYTPCNQTTSSVTYVAGTYNLCVSGSGISVATGSASSLGTQCSVIGCDVTPSNTNTPNCPCQFLFVNVFSGRYDFDYTDCNGVTQRRSSSSFPFCGVPNSIRNGSCAVGSCVGLNIRQGGDCCTFP